MKTSITTGSLGVGLVLVLGLAGCGGGAAGGLAHDADPLGSGPSAAPAVAAGAVLDGFSVIRYGRAGLEDSSLSGTLRLSYAGGDAYALAIGVRDAELTTAVCLDVHYDAAALHPTRAVFHHLLGDDAQALSAALLDLGGVAALGEVALGDYVPPALDGPFATLYFAPGPARGVSVAGGPHHFAEGIDRMLGGNPNIVVSNADPTIDLKITWYAAWHKGDGDQNSEVNIADLTPVGTYYHWKPFAGDSTWRAISADYNCPAAATPNTEVSIDDITEIAVYYLEKTNDYLVEVSDNVDGAPKTFVAALGWDPTALNPIQNNVTSVLGDLSTVFLSWTVDFANDPDLGVDYAGLKEIDADGDQIVTVYITPRVTNPPQQGYTVTRSLGLANIDFWQDAVIIDDLDVIVDGATGGGEGGRQHLRPDRSGGRGGGQQRGQLRPQFAQRHLYPVRHAGAGAVPRAGPGPGQVPALRRELRHGVHDSRRAHGVGRRHRPWRVRLPAHRRMA